MGNEISSLAKGINGCIHGDTKDRHEFMAEVAPRAYQTQMPDGYGHRQAYPLAPSPVAAGSGCPFDNSNKTGGRARRNPEQAAAAAAAGREGLEVPWLGQVTGAVAGRCNSRPDPEARVEMRTLGEAPSERMPAPRAKREAPNLESCTSNIAAAGSFQARKPGPLGAPQGNRSLAGHSFAVAHRSLESFACTLPDSAAAGQLSRGNADGSVHMKLPSGLAPSTEPGVQTANSFMAMNGKTPQQPPRGSGMAPPRSSSCAANQGSMSHARGSFNQTAAGAPAAYAKAAPSQGLGMIRE